MKRNIVYKSITRLLRLLPPDYKQKAFYQLILLIVNSFIDLLGLAAIIPLLAALLKKGFVHQQPQLDWLYTALGFKEDKWFIVFICFVVVFIVVSKNIFCLSIIKKQLRFSWDIHEYLGQKVFLSCYQGGLPFFQEKNSNQVQNRVVRVPQLLNSMISSGLIQFLSELTVLILVLVSITIYDPKIIGVLAFVVVPVFYFFYQKNAKKIKRLNKEVNNTQPKILKPVYEISFGFVDVAISGVFSSFQTSFSKALSQIRKKLIKVSLLSQVPNRLVEICVIFTVVILIIYAVFVLDDLEKFITLIGVFGLAAYRVVPSVNRLMLALINIKGGEYTLDVIEDTLARPNHQKLSQKQKQSFQKEIKILDLSYKFSEASEYLLKDISFTIKKGEIIGLVGRSGSGKTTLMNLLLGFLVPSKGDVLIDAHRLDFDSIPNWQNIIGYVRQDVFLIDGTVAENIAFGINNEKIDFEKLQKVAKMASLESFISTLPEGYNTNIGERGSKISGGQRQRIGIARALYHDAEVLFFDEATSALDEKTEKEITDAIESLRNQNLTMIIIAHRLSSLKYCDKVYKVEKGKVVLDNLNV